jgi:hypothetical protein
MSDTVDGVLRFAAGRAVKANTAVVIARDDGSWLAVAPRRPDGAGAAGWFGCCRLVRVLPVGSVTVDEVEVLDG